MNLFEERRALSKRRIQELREAIEALPSLRGLENLCIYVTGSYGRLEAHKGSDLDLFFVEHANAEAVSLGKIRQWEIATDVVRLARNLGFPEFSNEGEYLEFHTSQAILRNLGSREDDYKNYFTARLLLLLESRPIYNDDTYNAVLEGIVESYFRDWKDHQVDFRPLLLTNDIIRYWKTMCLNYEHKRNIPPKDESAKQKIHLKNLKLKFSRMLTCYSILACLGAQTVSPGNFSSLVRLTPLDRLRQLVSRDKKRRTLNPILKRLEQEYAWFLERSSSPSAAAWLGGKKDREKAFRRARGFGDDLFKLISAASGGGDKLRDLVV